jgi:protein-S-isoprenylcysteine O-methyltransferase Ste14
VRTGPQGFWASNRTTVHSLGFGLALIVAGPTWPLVLAGLPLLLIGLAIRTYALGYLVKDSTLCTSGPYAYVRNPLYLGSLFILAGACIAANNFYLTVIAGVVMVLFYVHTVRSEESFLTERFGDSFREYCARTPRLFPTRGRRTPPGETHFSWKLAAYNSAGELAGWVAFLFVVLMAKSLAGPHFHFWPYSPTGGPRHTYGIWWRGF